MDDNRTFEELVSSLNDIERDYLRLSTENELFMDEIKKLEKEKSLCADDAQLSISGVKLVEDIASARRIPMKARIESLATECVKNTYGSEYSVTFDYGVRYNRTVIDIYLVKNTPHGDVKRDIYGVGGGVSDSVSLPLKIMVLMKTQSADKILFADEPGKHMDEVHVTRFFEFIHELATRLNLQLIICSHHNSIKEYADTVYQVWYEDGKTHYKKSI